MNLFAFLHSPIIFLLPIFAYSPPDIHMSWRKSFVDYPVLRVQQTSDVCVAHDINTVVHRYLLALGATTNNAINNGGQDSGKGRYIVHRV